MFTLNRCPGPLCLRLNRCPGPLCLHWTDVLVFYVHIQRMSWSFMFTFNRCHSPLCSHSTDVLVLYVHIQQMSWSLCSHSTDVLVLYVYIQQMCCPLCLHSTNILVLYVHVQQMSWSFIFTFNRCPGPLCSMIWGEYWSFILLIFVDLFVDMCGLVCHQSFCWYFWTCLPSMFKLFW
jgi:hypothetical protein